MASPSLRGMFRSKPQSFVAALGLAGLGLAATSALPAGVGPTADVRLEWSAPEPAIEGPAGETVQLRFRVRNVGGQAAYAVVLTISTALGPQGAPQRIQPGPGAGESVSRTLALPLAEGMRELCIDALLQNLRAEDPADPNPGDNRICRVVRVQAKGSPNGTVSTRNERLDPERNP